MKQIFRAYFELVKFRLTATVVATSAFGYLLGCKFNSINGDFAAFQWPAFLGVFVGGLLVVFGSNGLNQVHEEIPDSKMVRTQNRPIVEGRLTVQQARVFSWFSTLLGVLLLMVTTSLLTALLGLLSFVLYVFVYTPMKGISPLAVMVGAIPGALPPLIGYTAFTGEIDEAGIILFLVQFFWQFPHFWAIAWLLHDDYQKAGYWLLPSMGGRDKKSSFQVVIYTLILIVASVMPVFYGLCSYWALIGILSSGIFFAIFAFKLNKTLQIADAKKLLYASFIYTPVVFLTYILF